MVYTQILDISNTTSLAGVNDWLEATKDMVISAYVETEPLEIIGLDGGVTENDLESTYPNISRKLPGKE